jgi:hypothetical protein
VFGRNLLILSRSFKPVFWSLLAGSLAIALAIVPSEYFSLHALRLAPVLPLGETSFNLPPVAELARAKESPLKAELFGYLRVFDKGSEAERSKARDAFRRRESSLDESLKVAMRLSVARSLAGLSLDGRKIRPASPAYREALSSATHLAGRLPDESRAWVLRYAISVWQRAEGRNLAWDKMPFRLNHFASLPQSKALIERIALEDLRDGKDEAAQRKYASLARSSSGAPVRALLDLRLLELKRNASAKTKNLRPYEDALASAAKEYVDPGILGTGNESRAKAVLAEIDKRHQTLVVTALNQASKSSASSRDRSVAIGMGERYLATLRDQGQIQNVKEKLAFVYFSAGQHARSVALYKELAGPGPAYSPEQKRYLAMAIRSQSILAAWPAEVPWQGFKGGQTAAREELLSLYKSIADSQNKGQAADWFPVAHAGLLAISLGRGEEAFKDWTTLLGSQPQGIHAAQAAGYMLTAYEKAQDYGSLEQIARLSLAKGISPIYLKAQLSPQNSLALALIEQGKKALEGQDFKLATTKLEEVVKKHGSYKRHDEGLYLLGFGYRGLGRNDEAIKVRVTFAESYPNSSFCRDALLTGGAWASSMAFEENAIYFKDRFLKKFPRDQESVAMRQQLLNLYLGREIYADALKLLEQTANHPGADGPTKAEALAQIMRIEEVHGSKERAFAVANRLMAVPGASNDLQAQAYAIKTRYFAKKGDWGEVARIETRLTSMGDEPFVREALGEARFRRAVFESGKVVKDVFNLELKDPYATLNHRYQAFLTARDQLLRVCQGGATSFCIPAMTHLVTLGTEFLKSTDEIEIQPTLAASVVNRFRIFKEKVHREGTDAVQRAEGSFGSIAREGYTSPDWVQASEWQKNAEWNIDRSTGETGVGYVQWSEGVEP